MTTTAAETLRRLARWNIWANRLVGDALRAAERPPTNAVRAFQHIFETELTWLQRVLAHENPNLPLWGEASVEQATEWEVRAEVLLHSVIARLDDAFLEQHFTYRNSAGQDFDDEVQEPLVQLLTHSQQYRGEAAAALNAADSRVPDFDYIIWVRLGRPA